MLGASNHRVTGKQPRPVRQTFTKFAQASTVASKFRLTGKQKPQLLHTAKRSHRNCPCTKRTPHFKEDDDVETEFCQNGVNVSELEPAAPHTQASEVAAKDAPTIARTLLSERPIEELQTLCIQDGLSDQGSVHELTERIIQHYVARSNSTVGAASEPAPSPEASAEPTKSINTSAVEAAIPTARRTSESPACTDIACVVDNLMDLVDKCGSPQVAQELVDCVAADDAASRQTRAAVRLALEHLTSYFDAERREVLDNIGMLAQLYVPTNIARPLMPTASTSLQLGETVLEVGSPTSAMQTDADDQNIVYRADNICSSSPMNDIAPITGSLVMVSDEDAEYQAASSRGEEDSTVVALFPETPKFPFGNNDFVEDLDVWIQRSLHRLQ